MGPPIFGDVAEWLNALPWKGSSLINIRLVGSNPTVSAKLEVSMWDKIKLWLFRIFSARAGMSSTIHVRPDHDKLAKQLRNFEKYRDVKIEKDFQCCGKGCSSHNENMRRQRKAKQRRSNGGCDPLTTATFVDASSSPSRSSGGGCGSSD